jgi:hypothetical protein
VSLLSGVVDYAVGQTLAGWVQSPHLAEIVVTASIDGTSVPAACVQDHEQPGTLKFRIALPRAITAGELIDRKITVEARNATERLTLGCWEPIQAAASIDKLTPNMIERMLVCVSQQTCDALSISLGQVPVLKASSPDKGIDPNTLDDLMRWS